MNKIIVKDWPEKYISGAKRCNLDYSSWLPDWFVGSGKDESCCLEGTWWDMICLARNILASKNTKMVAPEYYHPEWENNNYLGEEMSYEFEDN